MRDNAATRVALDFNILMMILKLNMDMRWFWLICRLCSMPSGNQYKLFHILMIDIYWNNVKCTVNYVFRNISIIIFLALDYPCHGCDHFASRFAIF